MKAVLSAVVVLVTLCPLAALADVVVLTDGSMLSGQVALAADTLTVTNAAGEFAVPRARVACAARCVNPAPGRAVGGAGVWRAGDAAVRGGGSVYGAEPG